MLQLWSVVAQPTRIDFCKLDHQKERFARFANQRLGRKKITGPQLSISHDLHNRLAAEFSPKMLEIINESHLHAGHSAEFDGSGETHLRIRIISSYFAGMNRVDRHRAINAICAEAFDAGLHALAIDARTPDEV
jgi:BolA family transcriptional regulator, general stress-responsive regulator